MGDPNAYYKDLCCALTLQSDKKGFFHKFAEGVTEAAGRAWLEGFGRLTTDTQRILKAYGDQETYALVQGTLDKIEPLYRTKSARLSKQRRQEADHLRYHGKLARAILMANQAVARAPSTGADPSEDDGLSLPLALWTRAGLFFERRQFDLALTDLQLALKYRLPDVYKADAYLMMAECYLELSEGQKAMVALAVVARMPGAEATAVKAASIAADLTALMKPKAADDKGVTEVEDESEEQGGGSTAMKAVMTETAGRSMTALRRVPPGHVLVAQAPAASVLFTDKHGTHCLHCVARLKTVVPCSDCSGVAFCSKECQEAGARYHQFECRHLELMIGSGMSPSCYLALRLVTQRSLKYFLDVRDRLEDRTFKHPYLDVYGLESHADKREPKDMLHRTLMALFLLRILRGGGYFGKAADQSSDRLSDDEAFMGSLLLRHLQVLQYNAHEIYETVMKTESDYRGAKTVNIGLGVYTTAALFNHECYPAVTRYFEGNRIVLRAVRPLEAGDTVSENYGPVFTVMEVKKRHASLASRYLFECSCVACLEDWPKIDDIVRVTFRCPEKGCPGTLAASKCGACSKTAPTDDLRRLRDSYDADFEAAVARLDAGELEAAERELVAFVERASTLVAPPDRNLSQAHEALRTVWAHAHNLFVLG